MSDTEILGRIHSQAWQETYVGILPAEVIAKSGSVEARTAVRREIFAASTTTHGHFLVESDQGEVVGFGDCGPAREVGAFAPAEITAIYLLRSAQRQGVGKKLLLKMLEHLANLGFEKAALRANIKNEKALLFYQHAGAIEMQRIEADYGGMTMPLVIYAWPDLTFFKPNSLIS